MIAYRIDKDLTISKVEGSLREILTKDIVWACLPYDKDNDIWYDDFGLLRKGVVLARIGYHRRVPLPVYILGADGERCCDPLVSIEDVEFVEC